MFEPQYFLFSEEESIDVRAGNSLNQWKHKVKASFCCQATGSSSLQFVLTVIHITLCMELLDRVIYKTLYGNPLDF